MIVNFMPSQPEKHDPHVVFFDKDRGADLYVRAAGGTYLPLKNGSPPAALPEGPQPDAGEQGVPGALDRQACGFRGAGTGTVTELRDISGAIDGSG